MGPGPCPQHRPPDVVAKRSSPALLPCRQGRSLKGTRKTPQTVAAWPTHPSPDGHSVLLGAAGHSALSIRTITAQQSKETAHVQRMNFEFSVWPPLRVRALCSDRAHRQGLGRGPGGGWKRPLGCGALVQVMRGFPVPWHPPSQWAWGMTRAPQVRIKKKRHR